jgi:hypothetical protein
MSGFPRFLCFIAFSGACQRREFKSTTKTKNVLQKQSCRKVFTKQSTKKSKTDFFDFFNHVFGRFSARGVQKQHKTNMEKISDPNLFTDPPPYIFQIQGLPTQQTGFFGGGLVRFRAFLGQGSSKNT